MRNHLDDPDHPYQLALDNTIGQSAHGWLISPENPILDANADLAFIQFTNAYVNHKDLYAVVPHHNASDPSIIEPFIQLWHKDAKVCNSDQTEKLEMSMRHLFDEFILSIQANPK